VGWGGGEKVLRGLQGGVVGKKGGTQTKRKDREEGEKSNKTLKIGGGVGGVGTRGGVGGGRTFISDFRKNLAKKDLKRGEALTERKNLLIGGDYSLSGWFWGGGYVRWIGSFE